MNTTTVRPQWPHTLEDIIKSLEGVWGLVGATAVNGNLMRLERSLHEPFTYIVTEHKGDDEGAILNKKTFDTSQRDQAITEFARAIGFEIH